MRRYLLLCLQLAVCMADTYLRQNDFANGTYRITQPGRYILAEDISFSPNDNGPTAYDSCWPTDAQLGVDYGAKEYDLGFFAAITVETTGVDIDLNGYILEQSPAHALLQRFFAIVELANSPFLPGQGPAGFTNNFVAAHDVTIHNGVLGRSSHHAIHGNLNTDITIFDLDFDGFEVAGVALNGVEGLTMNNCRLTNRKDVPVMGTFSAARFLQNYVDYLATQGSSTNLDVRGGQLSVDDVRDNLRNAINNVFADVLADGEINHTAHPVEHALFANVLGVIDGNSYGVLTNKNGVAVNDFPDQPKAPFTSRPSTNVRITNVDIYDLQSNIHEIVALVKGGAAVSDSRGSIFQLLNKDHLTGEYVTLETECDYYTANYKGNPVADAQLLVAKAIANDEFLDSGLDVSRNGITPDIIEWAEGYTNSPLSDIDDEGWQCNGDSMAHVQKGAIGFKIDGTADARLEDCSVNGVRNKGAPGSRACGLYTFSHPAATIAGYNGAHARGYTFAGSKKITVKNCYAAGIQSDHGDAYGFDVFTDSYDIDLTGCSASFINSDNEDAIGFHLGARTTFSNLKNWCSTHVTAPMGRAAEVWDQNGAHNGVSRERC